MPPLKPDKDKNFGGSLVLDFRQWWRHVKTIYWNCPLFCRQINPKLEKYTCLGSWLNLEIEIT